MAKMQRSLFAQLNALAEEIARDTVKSGAEKKAEPTPADPGGYQGASAHPSAHVDNKVQDASTGARASEYESDIKKQQGALAVDNTPELSQEGRQDEVQLNIGTNAKATGEDPSAEDDYKGDKDDPGTTHPARTDDGEKYSSTNFKEARAKCSSLGNEILADLVNFGTKQLNKKAEMPAALAEALHEKKETPAEEKAEHSTGLKGDQKKLDTDDDGKIEGSDLANLRKGDKKEAAFAAGYELAAKLGLDKEAAEASVREVCANTLREADEMADLFVGFYTTKAAEQDVTDDAAEGEDHSAPADAGSGEEGAEAPAEMAAMMGDAGGMGGGEPSLDAAPPSGDEAIQELAMALEELGIPPEALIAAAQQEGAAGASPAGAPAGGPAMGGMPGGEPKMAAAKKAQDLMGIGNEVLQFKRTGRFQIKEARTKRSRQLRDIMKAHVLELVAR